MAKNAINGQFRFARQREVLWPVTIRAPLDDGSGKLGEFKCRVRYKLLTKSEVQARSRLTIALGAAMRSDPSKLIEIYDADTAAKADQELLEHITGWDGIVDADSAEEGALLPFSAENLRALLECVYVRVAFELGLMQASQGAEAKN